VAAEPRADRLPPLPAGARIVIRLRAKPVATSLRARASIVAFVAAPLGLLVLVKLRRRAHGRAVRRRRSL
jgi:hypothetical protein